MRSRRPKPTQVPGRTDPSPLRVGMIGAFGNGNLGNDASMVAGMQILERIQANVEFVVYSPNPDELQRQFGIPARAASIRQRARLSHVPVLGQALHAVYGLADIVRAIRETKSLDVLVVPGTGILDDYAGLRSSEWPLTLAIWFSAARLRRVWTGLLSIGVGPLEDRNSRRLARLTAKLATYCSFRDQYSRSFMQDIGLVRRDCSAVPDIAFSLSLSNSAIPVPHSQAPVGVIVMNYLGWNTGARPDRFDERHARAMAQVCARLLRDGKRVRLITAHRNDGPATAEVARMIRELAPDFNSEMLSSGVARSLDELATLVSDTSAVIATRYHSVIVGLMCAIPTISVGYASKNDHLMASVGMAAYCQHVEEIDLNLLHAQVQEILKNRERLSAELTIRVDELRAEIAAEESRIAEILVRRD